MAMRRMYAVCLAAVVASSAAGTVFINEVFMNPVGSFDDTREFVELAGTPGMKLDGYAIAHVSGTEDKFFALGSIPPAPSPAPEIDEFFSLDGLELGANGLLVIGISIQSNYPTLLSDTNYQRWNTLWNGFYDTTGKLENDGSKTVMLIRNRPGATQATHPNPPAVDLRWGKDVPIDFELFTPVVDPQDGLEYDQFGDGSLDKGQDDGLGGFTVDTRGFLTPLDISDDLEVVDEVSTENGRGWEYDVDERTADIGGSAIGGLPERRVHALDDPQGFNPDAITRVDYRTKGDGWAPAPGATGEMTNGNNWQDTATEQWIRGESNVSSGGVGNPPQFFFWNDPNNANPDSVQPFTVNVPLWLDDANAPDYDFTSLYTYQIMAGRINPLATPIIPGDTDRDGDADADDIAKLAAVFGDDDWVFSNSFGTAPEGDSGDPATQTRPWDVDLTGDNGIECSDLQWVINFQGDATGQVVGVQYDSTTPAATGVHLNSNAGVNCAVTAQATVVSGNPLSALEVGDIVQLTVYAEITGGANATAGQENGVTQFVHDLTISTGGVLEVLTIQPQGDFRTTRAAIQEQQGTNGDEGVLRINGYATDSANGLSGAAAMYRVTLEAVGGGSADIAVSASATAKFAASTPCGLKVGHTDNHGNPASCDYPATIGVSVGGGGLIGDLDTDGDVDFDDLNILLASYGKCLGDAGYNAVADLDGNDCVDFDDLNLLLANYGA